MVCVNMGEWFLGETGCLDVNTEWAVERGRQDARMCSNGTMGLAAHVQPYHWFYRPVEYTHTSSACFTKVDLYIFACI